MPWKITIKSCKNSSFALLEIPWKSYGNHHEIPKKDIMIPSGHDFEPQKWLAPWVSWFSQQGQSPEVDRKGHRCSKTHGSFKIVQCFNFGWFGVALFQDTSIYIYIYIYIYTHASNCNTVSIRCKCGYIKLYPNITGVTSYNYHNCTQLWPNRRLGGFHFWLPISAGVFSIHFCGCMILKPCLYKRITLKYLSKVRSICKHTIWNTLNPCTYHL